MGITLDRAATDAAVTEMARRHGVSEGELWQTIVDSLEAAYLRLPDAHRDVDVEIDLGAMRISVISYDTGSAVDVTPQNFGRIAAGVFRGAVAGRLDAMLRARAANFAGREHTIVDGRVKHVTDRRAIVEVEGVEGVLPRGEMLPGERYAIGDPVTAAVLRVRDDGDDVLVLSRSDDAFVAALLAAHVPGIADGTIEVAALAREPGRRTKVVVRSNVLRDPVGATVGQQGAHISRVSAQLGRERIDVIGDLGDDREFVAALLGVPAGLVTIADGGATVDVSDAEKRRVIGFAGANVRLAQQLSGMQIRVGAAAA